MNFGKREMIHGRRDAADAFFLDPGTGPALAPDELAEELAEEFLTSATTGEEQGELAHERFVEEELGGPFVLTRARDEFSHELDPLALDSERESLPTPGPVAPEDSDSD